MRLLIISDTPMYLVSKGKQPEVFEPTLREIEFISSLFELVTWYGFLSDDKNPGHSRSPVTNKVIVSFLPRARGGKTYFKKLKIIPYLPFLFLKLWRQISHHDVIHTRGPSVPALIGILISFIKRKKIYWHKYAGNWMQQEPPLFYKIQKSILLKANHTHCTINGQWPNQPTHILSFENPCFTEKERKEAEAQSLRKNFDGKLIFCFVGLMSEGKGVINLLKGMEELVDTKRIEKIILVGDGPKMHEAVKLSETVNLQIYFTGYLPRKRINEIYAQSHFIILPSMSEGFPKVIAEAASYRCIPVVSNVSAIGQYVTKKNGFILNDNSPTTIAQTINQALNHTQLAILANEVYVTSRDFTYERYAERIEREILRGPIKEGK